MPKEQDEVQKRRLTAQKIADGLVKLHGEKIVAIFLYGSVARGDCGPYSDVEILALTKTPLQIKENYLLLDDVLYAIYCHTLEEAFKHLKQANKDLAIRPNVYLQAQALYDPQNLLNKLREAVRKLTEEQHQEAARRSLHELYEYYGKLRNACARKDLINAIYALDVMLEIAALLVALINRERFRGVREAATWLSALCRKNQTESSARLRRIFFNWARALGGFNGVCGRARHLS